jgi:hypothetical protein
MKPSTACLACSTLFSANACISGGIRNFSTAFTVVLSYLFVRLLLDPSAAGADRLNVESAGSPSQTGQEMTVGELPLDRECL